MCGTSEISCLARYSLWMAEFISWPPYGEGTTEVRLQGRHAYPKERLFLAVFFSKQVLY